jgi:diguanylate cyclase (GGDEF)-like protein
MPATQDTPESTALADLRLLKLEQARRLLGESPAQPPHPPSSPTIEGVQGVVDGLCELSQRDALTGLANRRYFGSVLEREVERVARSGEPTLLLMVDIDHFKRINDTHGHAAGDVVLREVSKILGECVRSMDVVARFGGEEFAVVLPQCHRGFGLLVAERVRRSVAAKPVSASPELQVPVTVSVGGAYAPEWTRSTANFWIQRADAHLYAAKQNGRNRVDMEDLPEYIVTETERRALLGLAPKAVPAGKTRRAGVIA